MKLGEEEYVSIYLSFFQIHEKALHGILVHLSGSVFVFGLIQFKNVCPMCFKNISEL
jgi:hypothetical protein